VSLTTYVRLIGAESAIVNIYRKRDPKLIKRIFFLNIKFRISCDKVGSVLDYFFAHTLHDISLQFFS